MMPDPQTIRQFHKNLGYSHRQLAKRFGVSLRQIQKALDPDGKREVDRRYEQKRRLREGVVA